MNTTAQDTLHVARTIMEQLGGRRFQVMTGAKFFVGDAGGLHFRLPSTPGYVQGGINLVKINLNDMDTYDVEFIKFRNLQTVTVARREGIYADMLRDVFESETGLRTSL